MNFQIAQIVLERQICYLNYMQEVIGNSAKAAPAPCVNYDSCPLCDPGSASLGRAVAQPQEYTGSGEQELGSPHLTHLGALL